MSFCDKTSFEIAYFTPANKVCGGYTGISLSVGWEVGLSAKSHPDNSS